MNTFKSGDFVKLRLSDRELEVRVLESSDPGIVLVKLSSGYNIGIPKEHILDSKVLEKGSLPVVSSPIKQESNLPKLGLIITGGTIASKLDSRTGGASHITSIAEFQRFYPAIFETASFEIENPFMMASENMTSKEWKIIAECAQRFLNRADIQGVIIAHGTDTIHYTSAALSFFLRDLNKPVVLTYSQRSIDRASSDADLNLKCAVRAALSGAAEVMLVGHAGINDDYCYALRGTKVRKMHSSRRDAFRPINTTPLARVWPEKVEFLETYRARASATSELDAVFSDKIALIYFYPGQGPDILEYYYKQGYKGVVVMGTGLGHVPSGTVGHAWTSTLKKLTKQGFIVCFTTQTLYGRVNLQVYSAGRELEKAGMIFLEDMLPETAFVKLGWILGHRSWKTFDTIKEKLLENIAGEFNPLLSD